MREKSGAGDVRRTRRQEETSRKVERGHTCGRDMKWKRRERGEGGQTENPGKKRRGARGADKGEGEVCTTHQEKEKRERDPEI